MNNIVDNTGSSSAKTRKNISDNIDEPNTGENLIKKLNYDCLIEIFMYLSILERLEVAKVCQNWKEVTKLAWYDVRKIDFGSLIISIEKREELLKILLMHCGKYLRHLSTINDQYPWICDVLNNINCQNIIHFDINTIVSPQCNIPHEDFVRTIKSMSKLKYLRVKMIASGSKNLCTGILEQLPNDMEEIHLLVSSPWYLSMESAKVPNKFHRVRCLTMQHFILTQSLMELILRNKNTLIYLDLAGCQFPPSISSVFPELNNLEHLNLDEYKNLNIEPIITTISRNSTNLKHFECVGFLANSIIPYHVSRELKYLKKLQHLKLGRTYITDQNGGDLITDITNNCKELKYLNIGNGDNFSASHIQDIRKLKNLEYLDVSEARIKSNSLIDIASNCLGLKELSMPFKKMNSRALEQLTNLKKLKKLNFSDCRNLTGSLLTKIVRNCKNLVDIDISNCNNITEASLIQVGKLEHLGKLSIENIINVPSAMFDNLRQLQVLRCRRCPSVTDENIINVIDNCHNLSWLDLTGSAVTVKTLVHATKRKFGFKILYISVHKSVKYIYFNDETIIKSVNVHVLD